MSDLGGRLRMPGPKGGVIQVHRACLLIDATQSHQCVRDDAHRGPHRCLCGEEWWRH